MKFKTFERQTNFHYEVFESPKERKEIYRYCKVLAEYIRNEKVRNLILPDAAARPAYVGVQEYLRKKYPNEKRPDTYFVNPKGFETSQVGVVINFGGMSEFIPGEGDEIEQEDIKKKFEEGYKRLVRNKSEPTVVFDTCMHFGETMANIKKTLEEVGFSNIKIVSVSKPDTGSEVDADFVITTKSPRMACYPFGFENMVRKRSREVTSSPVENTASLRQAVQLRREIKNIIDENI